MKNQTQFQLTSELELRSSEISAYDNKTQRLFVIGEVEDTPILQILDISDPSEPRLINEIDLSNFGAGVQSVAVNNGVVAVAISAQITTDSGKVAFFDSETLNLLSQVEVGVLPDMLTFTPDGKKLLVANEGEPNDDYTIDPEGSISIIDVSGDISALDNSKVITADFTAFNGREAELRAKGVRIFGPGASTSQDLEPEYIAVSEDSKTAFVTLQENNAFAVVDIENGTIKDVLPLGYKDYSQGQPQLTTYQFSDLPLLGTTAGGQEIKLGGLSGLFYAGKAANGNLKFVTVPDRGPAADSTDVDGNGDNERPFALPDYQTRVVQFELNEQTGEIENLSQIFLTRQDGVTPITGLPNIPGVDEEPVDLLGNFLDYDPLGADLEGIVIDDDGSFWMVDEYRPAIYHFESDGRLINRFVPQGTGALGGEPAGTFGDETLPPEYSNRRRNRGFEAVALDTENNILYAFIQTPLQNPDRATSNASDVIRILSINTETGNPVAEYVYLLEDAAVRPGGRVDKIGDAVYAGDGKFFVIERDSEFGAEAKKFVFEIDLKGATNLLEPTAPALLPGQTLEQHTADELASVGIQPVNKTKITNLPSIGYQAGDKPEGLALLDDGRLAVLNDNDFGLLDQEIPVDGTVALNPNPIPVELGIIEFSDGNKLDPSDRDGGINLNNFPVKGMYQPDVIASFTSNGQTYYITANEGDARDYDGFSEETRIKDVILDPEVFPNAEELQKDENLGRLKITNTIGDLDGDGDFDQLYAYGGRSFTIWDESGNLVFDSSDEIAKITAQLVPDFFNTNDADPEKQDSRSDDKGAEPEGVTVGKVGGRTLAFIGLERTGGIMVYDVTEPTKASFVQYLDGGIAPEGLSYIPAEDSPNGKPLLVVTNEESNTIDIFETEDTIEAIVGSNEAESLFGTVGEDIIKGKDGDDQIFGSEGVNTLYGDRGDDTIYGGSQADTIYGGADHDLIFADGGDNFINGGLGNDTIYTGSGNDTIVGGFGDDTIWLGGGHDVVVLELGNGTDIINNFQLGQTTFDVSGNTDSLSIIDGSSGAEISVNGNLIAIVSWTQASTLNNHIDTLFA